MSMRDRDLLESAARVQERLGPLNLKLRKKLEVVKKRAVEKPQAEAKLQPKPIESDDHSQTTIAIEAEQAHESAQHKTLTSTLTQVTDQFSHEHEAENVNPLSPPWSLPGSPLR